MNLQDRHVVVTGGGSGVGAKTARAFAAAGAKVTVMGRSEKTLLEQNLSYAVCDVTDAGAMKSAMEQARRANGPIHIAIANAGAVKSQSFAKMQQVDLQAMLDVNLCGVVNTWQAALADMQSAGWGRMIAIASTASLRGYPLVSGYCAAKHAVLGLTRALAKEFAKTNITVNAICPGYTKTPLLEGAIQTIVDKTGMSHEQASDILKSDNPQNRFIQPEEVADTALWLCGNSARSINGHALTLSGGEL